MSTASMFVLGSFVAAMSVKVARLPTAGESLLASAFDMSPGGKGWNQAVGAHRLGARVEVMLAVGDDAFAAQAERAVAEVGFAATHWCRHPGQTGCGIGFIDELGENCIAVAPGANWRMDAADVERVAARVAAADLVSAQFEIPDAPILAAFRIAREHGRITLLNPSPWRAPPAQMLALTSVLVLNHAEAAAMAELARPSGTAADRIRHAGQLAARLRELGPRVVVITLGGEGALACDEAGSLLYQAALPVQAVDTIGAGDAFTAALAADMLAGVSLAQALRTAAAAGALATTALGVYEALPCRHRVHALLAEQTAEQAARSVPAGGGNGLSPPGITA